jgi:putative ABC transport system permease protein
MFDLEELIKKWKKGLAANQNLEDGYIAELESHLRDEVEDFVRQGMSTEEAFRKASEAMGESGQVGSEFYKVYTTRRSGRPSWQPPRFVPGLVWNYFKVTLRIIKRQKGYSFLNIAGLAVGMAAFLLIFLYCSFELSYDNFHKNGNRIYRIQNDRVYSTKHDRSAGCTPGVGPTMKKEFPEIADFTRLLNVSFQPSVVSRDSSAETGFPAAGESQPRSQVISFYEKNIFFAEGSFLRIFSFPLVKGSPETALAEPNTVVLSESRAKKYFSQDDPMGKLITVGTAYGRQVYKITGVFKDVPENSHLKFDFLLSFPTLGRLWPATEEQPWSNNSFLTYVLLSSSADPRSLEMKFLSLNRKYPLEAADYKREFHLQPLRSIHLHSRLRMEPDINGDSKTVAFLEIIGAFILIIAWINSINMATARSLQRGKEVGIRKTLGAQHRQLIRQFLFESTFLNLLAFLLAFTVVSLILPAFGLLVGKTLSLSFMGSGWTWVGFSILAGALLSGLYPAFVLSSFRPVSAIKGLSSGILRGAAFRKSLILFQFAVSVFLIASTLVIGRQLAFMQNQDLGLDMERTMTLRLSLSRQSSILLKEQMSKLAPVATATLSSSVPGWEYSNAASGIRRQTAAPEEAQHLFFMDVDEDYFQLFGIPLLCGRAFSKDYQTDRDAVVLNEETVKLLGFDTPEEALQEKIVLGGFGDIVVNVIGVVKDYHHKILRDKIEAVIYSPLGRTSFLSLRIREGQIGSAVSLVEKKWKELFPGQPLEYFFIDDAFNNQYQSDEKLGQVFGLSALLAILISCLGLFGLAAFSAERRTKEIGIRKVFGASAPEIAAMLSMEFTKGVLLANLIAWPVTYFVMNKWLQAFAYRTTVGLWTLGISSLLSLIIALLTVSYQTLKAALADPVKSLRYE